jgi:hypothetical protein
MRFAIVGLMLILLVGCGSEDPPQTRSEGARSPRQRHRRVGRSRSGWSQERPFCVRFRQRPPRARGLDHVGG